VDDGKDRTDGRSHDPNAAALRRSGPGRPAQPRPGRGRLSRDSPLARRPQAKAWYRSPRRSRCWFQGSWSRRRATP